MKQVDARQLVIVDECGSHIGLTSLYAWAPRGERAHGSIPRNRGKNTTLMASLSLSGIGAAMIIEGSTNASAFEVYVEQILAPRLESGQLVGYCQLHGNCRVISSGFKVKVGHEPKFCPKNMHEKV